MSHQHTITNNILWTRWVSDYKKCHFRRWKIWFVALNRRIIYLFLPKIYFGARNLLFMLLLLLLDIGFFSKSLYRRLHFKKKLWLCSNLMPRVMLGPYQSKLHVRGGCSFFAKIYIFNVYKIHFHDVQPCWSRNSLLFTLLRQDLLGCKSCLIAWKMHVIS